MDNTYRQLASPPFGHGLSTPGLKKFTLRQPFFLPPFSAQFKYQKRFAESPVIAFRQPLQGGSIDHKISYSGPGSSFAELKFWPLSPNSGTFFICSAFHKCSNTVYE
jgi:hypothetical protein